MVSVIHAAYISQRLRGKFSGEIHGHQSWKDDRTFSGAGAQIINADLNWLPMKSRMDSLVISTEQPISP